MKEGPPEQGPPEVQRVQDVRRLFEQGPDAISFYADFVQVFNTGSELILTLYETIPGPPAGTTGQVAAVTTRLRASVVLGPIISTNLAKLFRENADALREQLRASLTKLEDKK